MSVFKKNAVVSVLGKTAYLGLFADGKPVLVPVRFPAGVGRSNALTDGRAFRRLMGAVRAAAAEYEKDRELQYIFTVRNSWGMRELLAFRSMAAAAGVSVKRVISENAAVAVDIRFRDPSYDGTVLIASAIGGESGMEAFDIGSGIVEKLASYFMEKPGVFAGYSSIPMRMIGATAVYCVAEEEKAGGDLLHAIQKRLVDCPARCYLASGSQIASGASVIAAMLNGEFPGPVLLDTFSPYGLYVSAGEQFCTVIPPDTTIPVSDAVEIDLPQIRPGQELTFCEKRGKKYQPFGTIRLLPEDAAHIGSGTPELSLDADVDRNLTLNIRAGSDGEWREIRFSERLTRGSAGTRGGAAEPTADDGAERMAQEFFPVLDSLLYGIRSSEERNDPHAAGLRSIYDQALAILRRRGICPIEAEGKPFDCRCHNAVGHVTDSAYPPNTVVRVVRPGFVCRGKILRYPDVIVAN